MLDPVSFECLLSNCHVIECVVAAVVPVATFGLPEEKEEEDE
jgi:hypothetical protein